MLDPEVYFRAGISTSAAARAFVAAARTLNFRRAAERLSVTQGAVSQQVARLEDYFGCRLFERGLLRPELFRWFLQRGANPSPPLD